jgi:hypothetical protein
MAETDKVNELVNAFKNLGYSAAEAAVVKGGVDPTDTRPIWRLVTEHVGKIAEDREGLLLLIHAASAALFKDTWAAYEQRLGELLRH